METWFSRLEKKGKISVLFPAVLFCLFFCAAPPPDFYIWQRQGAIPPRPEQGGRFFVWAAELSEWKTAAVDSSRNFMEQDAVPVVRIQVSVLSDPRLVEKLVELNRKFGAGKLQLDCDVPESRLGEYGEILRALRETLGSATELSATFLPCHVGHEAVFRSVVRPLDFYVLQLHGIERPVEVKLPYRLMRKDVCTAAIAAARRIGKPFAIALPTYAYRLYFHRETGKFAGLSAEAGGAKPGRFLEKLVVPDKTLIAELRRENADLPAVYFRYPAPGDRLNFDIPTILALDAGRVPREAFSCVAEKVSDGVYAMKLANTGCIRLAPVAIQLRWRSRRGEALLFDGTHASGESTVYGVLPERLDVQPPPCGKTREVARFLTSEPPQTIELTL